MLIGVVGGSIGGLAVGILLQKQGHEVHIFERSTLIESEAGGGIVMQHPVRKLFGLLGLSTEEIEKVFVAVAGRQFVGKSFEILDESGQVEVQDAERMVSPQEMTSWSAIWWVLKHHFPETHYHKGMRLLKLEYGSGNGIETVACANRDRVRLEFEHVASESVKNCLTNERPVGISVGSADGNSTFWEFDVVIGADGQSSTVRREVLKQSNKDLSHLLEYAGYVAWRGVIPVDKLPESYASTFNNWFTFYHSDKTHILMYMIPQNDGYNNSTSFNWVWYWNIPETELAELLKIDREETIDRKSGTSSTKSVATRNFSVPPGKLSDLAKTRLNGLAVEQLPSPIAKVVTEHTDQPFLQPIYDYRCDQAVFDGESSESAKVILMGDALCVVRPHTAYGTAKAVEDAMEIAKAIGPVNSKTSEGRRSFTDSLLLWQEKVLLRNAGLSNYGERLGSSQRATK